MKITEYHREIAGKYYSKLINKYGMTATVRQVPRIKEIIWTPKGLKMLERAERKRK